MKNRMKTILLSTISILSFVSVVNARNFSDGGVYNLNDEGVATSSQNKPFSVNNGTTVNVKAGTDFIGNYSSSSGMNIGMISSTNSILNFCNGLSSCDSNMKISSNYIAANGGSYPYAAGAFLYTSNGEVLFGNNVEFVGNRAHASTSNNDTASSRGGVLYVFGTKYDFGNNIKFEGNISSATSSATNYSAGASAWGGAIMGGSNSEFNFGDNVEFTRNSVTTSANSAYNFQNTSWGGAIAATSQSTFNFGNNVKINDNKSTTIANGNNPYNPSIQAYGGGIFSSEASFNFNGDAEFINNYVSASASYSSLYLNAQGGAIYANHGSDIRFNGSVLFSNNSARASNGKHYGGALYVENSTVSFSPRMAGQSILFENNYVARTDQYNNIIAGSKKLNSMYLMPNATVDFNLTKDTLADIRDPIAGNGTINKNGLGGLYIWGNNNEYTGILNINEGSLYAMFEDTHDIINDEFGQRLNSRIQNANINFANGSIYRPRITTTKMASIDKGKTTVGNSVVFLPYELSKLDVGVYNYDNDYSKFQGWESSLAKVNPSSTTSVEIKRDLEGYKGLSEIADFYRKRDDLSYAERDELDYLYYTGVLSDKIKDMFDVVEGDDYANMNETHKTSIRQFGRQIASRIQNKDCPECGQKDGYSSEHAWFNMSQNFMKKDTTNKSIGYEYNPTSFAAGYDYDLIAQELNVGVAVSYAFGDATTKGSGVSSENNINEYLLSAYGKYKPSKAYISGSIGGGLITNETKLSSVGANSKGTYNTSVIFANAEVGYGLVEGAYGLLEPFVGLEYTYINNASYNEKGVGARHFDNMDWNTVEVPVGVRLSKDFNYGDTMITPAVELAYVRNVGDTGASTRANFVGNAGSSWKISSSSEAKDSIRSNVNLKLNSKSTPLSLNVGYARDTRSDYRDDQGYITVRYNF